MRRQEEGVLEHDVAAGVFSSCYKHLVPLAAQWNVNHMAIGDDVY